jgi:hypothetical protein
MDGAGAARYSISIIQVLIDGFYCKTRMCRFMWRSGFLCFEGNNLQ